MIVPIAPHCPLFSVHAKSAVSRAVDYNPEHHNPVGMLCSQKLNGIRCIVHLVPNQRPRYYTRNGHEITGLEKLDETLIHCMNDPVKWGSQLVLDGELSLLTEHGWDDFAGLVSAIQRKEYVIPQPRLHAFDILTPEEFRAGRTESTFAERQQSLRKFIGDEWKTAPRLELVHQTVVTSKKYLAGRVALAASCNWEGLVLRSPDSLYRNGPDEQILKVKRWTDLECRVVDCCVEYGRLARVQVEYIGIPLTVTYGFSDKQRTAYGTHPERLLGAVVTIAFTADSLTAPRVLHVYEGGRPD